MFCVALCLRLCLSLYDSHTLPQPSIRPWPTTCCFFFLLKQSTMTELKAHRKAHEKRPQPLRPPDNRLQMEATTPSSVCLLMPLL